MNKHTIFAYRSGIGVDLEIAYHPRGWILLINGNSYGEYASAEAAAEAVATCKTGCAAWDTYIYRTPLSLTSWEDIRQR